MTGAIETRLKELGIELAEPPRPVASYVGFVQTGNLVFVSGQLPLADGKLLHEGLVGRDVSPEQGAEAARQCAINLLAQARQACGGDLDRIVRCVRLGGFVASTPDFTGHPQVINGASNLIGEALGEKGVHARAAVGVGRRGQAVQCGQEIADIRAAELT